jgi:REP element-mobilizing transposase RayT
MLDEWWQRLSAKFEEAVELDEFIVMPNHVHGIIWLVPGSDTVGAAPRGRPNAVSLPEVLDWYKTMTTNAYIRGVREHGWTPFAKRVWQRGYYEHVVRDDADLNRIRQYIIDNPTRWSEDEENPDAHP